MGYLFKAFGYVIVTLFVINSYYGNTMVIPEIVLPPADKSTANIVLFAMLAVWLMNTVLLFQRVKGWYYDLEGSIVTKLKSIFIHRK